MDLVYHRIPVSGSHLSVTHAHKNPASVQVYGNQLARKLLAREHLGDVDTLKIPTAKVTTTEEKENNSDQIYSTSDSLFYLRKTI